ncbi:winged helix-turn-helix domain-containing protein [Piscinibacter sp. XHJ-5]|uniref:ATP-binding protein n=1 Tax=Piscinibacter sp. XHJ-5 TaxID=3037797 RepID=UPI0024535137|nr:winged helix-turn-helix domain-containing protein [Piscinibacter sp. XHJ-5]
MARVMLARSSRARRSRAGFQDPLAVPATSPPTFAASHPLSGSLRFGRCELQPRERRLLVDGKPAPLGARAFDVLVALAERSDRLVSKHELLDLVWPGLVVEENNLATQVSSLRKVLGGDIIATIPGHGYRFTAAFEPDPAREASRPRAAQRPEAPSPADASSNLPAVLSALIGREADLAAVRQLVSEHRLVTLAGAGGIGKTRLAEAAAHSMRSAFADGVWMVELAAIADPALVPTAVAQTLRISLPGEASPLDELVARIRSEAMLLVLDNCEHLVGAVSALVDALLRQAPRLHILATSQQLLRVGGERVMRVGTLAVPEDAGLDRASQHGAVALFVERVAALQPGFALTDRNVAAVIDICRCLDGVALALELAAARVPLLGVQGVRDRLGERLRMLTGGSRVSMPRHQTLRAALDWGHALLSRDEQAVFRRLGVFAGGFGLELAQQVASDEAIDAWAVLDHLGTLVDKSMVVTEPGEVPRYRLLETARAYALERLAEAGEEAALRKRHAQCIQGEIHRHLRNRPRDEYTRLCLPELDNLRAAVEWASGAGGDTGLALALVNDAAVLMYQVGLYPECMRWMLALESRVDDATPALTAARFRFGLALVTLHGGVTAARREQLLESARAGFASAGKPHEQVLTLLLKVHADCIRGDFTAAQEAIDQAQGLCGDDGPVVLRAHIGYAQGFVHRNSDRRAEALQAFTQALPLARAAGDARNCFNVLNNLGAVQFEMGNVDEAVGHHRSLVEQGRRAHFDSEMMALSLGWLSCFLAAQGSLEEARQIAREAVPYMRRAIGVRHFCMCFAMLAARQGRDADAARLRGADEAARARRSAARTLVDLRTLEATLSQIEADHPQSQVAAWHAEGALLDDDAIVALALGAS